MLIKQKGTGSYAKKKYSEIKDNDSYVNAKSAHGRADWTVGMLLANHYAVMNGYAINEVLKAIRTLRELGIEYTMKTIEGPYLSKDSKVKEMFYEFTTPLFIDDRVPKNGIQLFNQLEEQVAFMLSHCKSIEKYLDYKDNALLNNVNKQLEEQAAQLLSVKNQILKICQK